MLRTGIVAFAFGTPGSILSNQHIAQIAIQLTRENGYPIYTQRDVPLDGFVDVTYTEETYGDPPPTLRISRGAVKWAQERGIKRLQVIAAKPHLRRCVRDLKQAVSEARVQLTIQVSEAIHQYSEEEWFCGDSTQSRTCSRKNWNKRERILMLLPFWLYKRVAS